MYKSLIAAALTVAAGASVAGDFQNVQAIGLGETVIDIRGDSAFSFNALAGHTYQVTLDLATGAKSTFEVWLSNGLNKSSTNDNDLYTFAAAGSTAAVGSTTQAFNQDRQVYINVNASRAASPVLLAGGAPGYYGTMTVTMVPEPATTALFLAGLGALGIVGRRRKTQG
jgi:hypothetical protein